MYRIMLFVLDKDYGVKTLTVNFSKGKTRILGRYHCFNIVPIPCFISVPWYDSCIIG